MNFHIVLVEPEIPANTGNIARTCVATNCDLHLVGKLGFSLEDRYLRRAGLDYWPHLTYYHHLSWDAWWKQVTNPDRVFLFSTKVKKPYFEEKFRPGDWLVFGKETKGLGQELLAQFPEQALTIPMPGPVRSLNLSNSAAIVVYEALRQTQVQQQP